MAYSLWDKQPEQVLPKLPFELIVSLAEMTRKKEEEASTAADKINESLLNIPAIPKDVAGRDQKIAELQQRIYDVADRYSNNMAQALPALKSLQRDINKEMTTGYLSGVKNRYNGYLESVKNAKELEQEFIKSNGKQGMSPEDVQNMLNRELTDVNYNGAPIQRNPDGSWQSYKPFERQATYNFADKSNELGKWMGEHPEVVTQLAGLQYDPKTGYYVYGDVTKKVQTSEAIERALKAYFRNDPEATRYIDWEAGVSGKHDAARKMVTEGMQRGYVPVYDNRKNEVGAYNPETWIRDVYTENLYSKADAAARAASSIYTRNEIDRSQGFEWNKLAEEQRKGQEEAGITLFAEAPLADVESTNADSSFFDMQTFTPRTTVAGGGTGGMGVTTGGIITLDGTTADELAKPLDTRKEYFNDLNTLPTGQRMQADSYLRTLSKSTDQPEVAAAAQRLMSGKASLEDQKLVYPLLKQMNSLAEGSTLMNSNVQSLSSKAERRMVNTLLGTSSDEAITVKELGTGFGGNLRVYVDSKTGSIPYKDWVEQMKKDVNADAKVSIQGKLNGTNAFTNKTGDKTFGNAYQIVVNGIPYYIHGDYQIAPTSNEAIRLEGERVRSQHVAMLGQAQTAPTGTFQGYYYDQNTPIEWTYGSDKKYRLTGFGKDADGNIINVTPTKDTVFNSAEEMEVALRALKMSLGK